MDLAEDKTVGLNGDYLFDSDTTTGAAMQVDVDSERAEHDKVGKDIGGLGHQDQQMSTEEKPYEQSDGALQTSLLPNTATEPETEPPGDVLDPMRVADVARVLKPKDRRVLTPKTSHEEAPDRKAAKVHSLGEPGSSTGNADLSLIHI